MDWRDDLELDNDSLDDFLDGHEGERFCEKREGECKVRVDFTEVGRENFLWFKCDGGVRLALSI